MLRLSVLILLLLNLAYLAWSQGALRAYGLGPIPPSEPQRLERQLHPEQVRLLSREEGRQAEALARQMRCMQAGPFNEKQMAALLTALAPWPLGSWRVEGAVIPPRWLVYVGRFDDPAALARRRTELTAQALSGEPTAAPELSPGLSLGYYPTQDQAQQALAGITSRGVRDARVVQESTPGRGTRLVLPFMDEALRSRLDALSPALAGKALRPCNT